MELVTSRSKDPTLDQCVVDSSHHKWRFSAKACSFSLVLALALVLASHYLWIRSEQHVWLNNGIVNFFSVAVSDCLFFFQHCRVYLLVFISFMQWFVVLMSLLLCWAFAQPLQTCAHAFNCATRTKYFCEQHPSLSLITFLSALTVIVTFLCWD